MAKMKKTIWSPKMCELCDKRYIFNDHHLKPLTKTDETIQTCGGCHMYVHILFTNEELDKKFNTLEKLKKEFEIRMRKKNYEIRMNTRYW
jgi:hypothetical protein